MTVAKQDTFRATGATLFYRVRGSGPLLMILAGGHGDADTTEALCDRLVDRYTVVTYDRRGLSRSKLDAPPDELPLSTHADDVHHLLAALTSEPVMLFGSSLGALIGLDLVARHPRQVRVLVAHEPPAWNLLAQAERNSVARTQEEVEDTFRRDGVGPAFTKFAALAAIDLQDREPDVTLSSPTPQWVANLSFFFTYDSPAVRHYRLEPAAVQGSAARIVPACGQSNPTSAPYRAVATLAEKLGRPLVAFPGGHTGWLLRPTAFAAKLHDVLAQH